MRNFMSKLGLAVVICLSFMLSEKTAMVVKDMDDIMIKLRDVEKNYNVEPENATIDGDEIVPGINGRRVNITKSYKEMKKIGSFNEKYLIYDEIFPDITLVGNYDKVVVGGNKVKNAVSLLFIVYGDDDINIVLEILREKHVNAVFFVDGRWFENNNELAMSLIRQGHNLGNLSYNRNYQNSEFVWMNNIFKMIGKQKINYCYDTAVYEDLQACAFQKNYTIRPNIVVTDNPLFEIKGQIRPGSLISFNINDRTNEQLGLVVDYIKSRGYSVENLTSHLSEKNSN